jgi:hypothetical protein
MARRSREDVVSRASVTTDWTVRTDELCGVPVSKADGHVIECASAESGWACNRACNCLDIWGIEDVFWGVPVARKKRSEDMMWSIIAMSGQGQCAQRRTHRREEQGRRRSKEEGIEDNEVM